MQISEFPVEGVCIVKQFIVRTITCQFTAHLHIQGCAEMWPGSSTDGTVYSISMFFLQYGLPLSVISFAYARIWSKLRKHVSPGGGRSDRHRRRQKTTKMLAAVVAVFAISWLPFHAFQLSVDIDNSMMEMKDFKLLYTVFHIVAMCSAFANPILYGWMNRNYRGAFAAVCKCVPVKSRLRKVHSRDTVREKALAHQSTISVLTQANTPL